MNHIIGGSTPFLFFYPSLSKVAVLVLPRYQSCTSSLPHSRLLRFVWRRQHDVEESPQPHLESYTTRTILWSSKMENNFRMV
jgi:hypothetical protein